MINQLLSALAVAALGMLALAVLVSITWFTFRAATVIRSAGGRHAERWVREALGAGAVVRDLGDQKEAENQLGEVHIRITWTEHQTRIRATGPGSVPADAVAVLDKLGRTRTKVPVQWEASRPPDPQLARVVSILVDCLGP